METNWNYDSPDQRPVETLFNAMERRRKLKPIVVAIALMASFALALLIAAVWAGSAPNPYSM
jgi:hypothetical protein